MLREPADTNPQNAFCSRPDTLCPFLHPARNTPFLSVRVVLPASLCSRPSNHHRRLAFAIQRARSTQQSSPSPFLAHIFVLHTFGGARQVHHRRLKRCVVITLRISFLLRVYCAIRASRAALPMRKVAGVSVRRTPQIPPSPPPSSSRLHLLWSLESLRAQVP